MENTVPLNFEQIKKLIINFELEKKIEIIKMLENDTFPDRFARFLEQMKTDEITFDEITSEVEFVREKRYEEKKNKNCN